MDISVNWLRALAPGIQGTATELADRLSMQAIPVDRVVPVGNGLDGIVVARVVEAGKHPNADRLTLCRVDAGRGELIDVVCGAPNVEQGSLYPYVAPGASLPGGFEIESRKIRGEMSHGMLCSEKELGLGRDAGGILRLDGDFVVGQSFVEAMALPDARLELDLTPNRIDLACHVGVARELVPDDGPGVVLPPFDGPSWDAGWVDGVGEAESGGVRIVIEDAERCHRYLGAIVRGITVGPSPEWLQARLRGAGARPINNVVDATNYVLLELNQPLHAFDLAKIGGSEIRVRAARASEKLRTLDGADHELTPVATVIADAKAAIALAGVMGGEDSEVTRDTTDLLIECAAFDPRHTRHTARETGLSTDASYRFERGIDETGQEGAIRRCVELILAIAGGEADPDGIRVGTQPPSDRVVTLRISRSRQVLGLDLSANEVTRLIAPIGFHTRPEADESDVLFVTVPGWRGDVTTEADLLEEVARRFGYDSFPRELRSFRPSGVPDCDDRSRAGEVRQLLVARGFHEARSVPFVPESRSADSRIPLLNPLSGAEGFLRTDLVPVLLSRVEHNWSRGHRDVRLFEVGTVFGRRDGSPADLPTNATPEQRDAANPFAEERRFAFVLTGARVPAHWSAESPDADIWDLVGLVEELAEEFGLGTVGTGVEPDGLSARPLGFESWLGEAAVRIGGNDRFTGVAGQVKATMLDEPRWSAPVFAGEFRLDPIRTDDLREYQSLPQYPAVSRDLAFTLATSVPVAEVERTILAAAPPLLTSARLFDVYEGDKVEEGRRSLAWRLVFRAPDRTLTDPEVDEAVAGIVHQLEEELDVRIRAS
jgi:phenylalanyl-tRNA synthetase beta chain